MSVTNPYLYSLLTSVSMDELMLAPVMKRVAATADQLS